VKAFFQKYKLWIFGAALILIAAWIFWGTAQKGKLSVRYREFKVERSDLQVTVTTTGTVAPENRLEIKPPIAGRAESVRVNEGDQVKKGQILAWMSSTERAALLDAARSQGASEVKKWEDLYRPTPILAPINGTIILRNIEAGQTFTQNDAVLVMSDRLTVKAQVDETDISEVKLKQRARIILDAYPSQMIPGQIDQIAYDAKTVNNVTTYIVDVLPDEAPAFMRSGMTANIVFLVASKSNVLTVPNDALRVLDGKFSILLKNAETKKSEDRLVEVGLNDGKKTEIISGLNEGDTVLVAEIKSTLTVKPSQSGSPFSPIPPRHGGR
jgi:macrolide-specific efflux system membrane fusion protein